MYTHYNGCCLVFVALYVKQIFSEETINDQLISSLAYLKKIWSKNFPTNWLLPVSYHELQLCKKSDSLSRLNFVQSDQIYEKRSIK